jgi:hypothetical protein
MSFLSALLTGSQKTTQDQSSQSQQQMNSSGTSSARRFMTDGQQAVMGDTGSYIRNMLTNPAAATAPARTASINSVNNNFVGAGKKIRGKFMQGGGNASGKGGRANREAEMGRLGAINDTNLSFDQKGLDLQQLAAQLGLNFSNINMGQDASTSATSNGTSSSTGRSVTTQQSTPSILSSIQTLASLLTMGEWGKSGGKGGGKGNGDFGGET